MLEICKSMNAIINEGKALYWGTSCWPLREVIKCLHLCD